MKNASLQNLRRLLVDYIESRGDLPNIHINSGSGLSVVVDALRNRTIENTEDTATLALTNVIDDFITATGEEFFVAQTESTFNAIIGTFTKRINSAFGVIRSIHKLVDEITNDIDNRIDEIVAQNPYLTRNLNVGDSSIPDFPEIDWSTIYELGPEDEIIERMNSVIPRFAKTDITNPEIMASVGDLLLSRIQQEYKDLSITDETRDRIAAELVEKHGGSTDVYVALIMSMMKRSRAMLTIGRYAKQASTIVNSVSSVESFVGGNLDTLIKVIDHMRVTTLSSNTREALESNLKLAELVSVMMGYYLVHARRVLYVKTILLPTGQLNPDVKEEFEQAGGTMVKLAHHVNFFYPEDKLRHTQHGITITSVIESDGVIKEEVEQNQIDTKVGVKSEMNKVIISAFSRRFIQFLDDCETEDYLFSLHVPRKQAEAMLNMTFDRLVNNTTIEDALYELILKSCVPPRDFVIVLYRRLGNEMLKELAKQQEINENQIRLIETKVFASMVTEFIVNADLVLL